MYFTNMEYAVSILVTSELRLPSVRKRGCCVPKINRGRETALPCPLYYSEPAGIDITALFRLVRYTTEVGTRQCRVPTAIEEQSGCTS